MRSLLLDLTCALRALRAAPLFTLVAACTLALGIAFNGIIFTIVNSVLLRPLPYPNSDRIVVVLSKSAHGEELQDLATPALFSVTQNAKMLSDVAVSYPTEAGVNLSGPGRPQYARALRVSAGFFSTLRAAPVLGRTFDEEEDSPGGSRVAVLSYGLWKRSMGDRAGLGVGWQLNGENYKVVGVMPKGFRSYPEAELWLPLQLSPKQPDPGGNYRVIARIRDGFSAEQAQQELQDLTSRDSFPDRQPGEHASLVLQRLQQFESRDVRQRLLILSGAVFVVLLISCANIAMLLLVRAVARSHEIGVRLALGSSQTRLIQLFFLEGAVISAIGGLLGLILSKELLPIVLFLAPPGLPRFAEVHLDWRVAGFTCAISAFTALLFGMATGIRLSRLKVGELLRATTLRATAGGGQTRAARTILVLQIALTLILLSGAMLFWKNLLVIDGIDPGFDSRQTTVAQVTLMGRGYETTPATTGVLDQILKNLQTSQLVNGAATISSLPLEKGLNVPIRTDDGTQAVEGVEYRSISPDYFSVMEIPLRSGRQFTSADGPQTQQVAIVNMTLAKKWWPDGPATGHYITVGKELGPDFTDSHRLIVGVVADVHQSSLEQPSWPTVFVPTAQVSDSITAYTNQHFLTSIVIRTPEPAGIQEQVRNAIEAADPRLSVVSYRPLRQIVRDSTIRDRFYTFLSVIFGVFALFITAVGVYGLLSYQIGVSAREIAVRISFGASPAQAILLMVRQSMQLVAIGALVGAAGCVLLIFPFVKSWYNFSFGPLGGGIALLGVVTILSSLIAALRIASIEPMVVLRNE